MASSFRPTREVASAARRGLRLREKFGRGGTDVGVRRAHQLAEQNELDVSDMGGHCQTNVTQRAQQW